MYSDNMLNGIRIYTADPIWRQILADLNADVLDAADIADVDFDSLNIDFPVSVPELKSVIFNALDNTHIINQIFGKNVSVTRLQAQILAWLHKSGGMCAADLKAALGYAADATTHTVDTAIYQLRKAYGRDFILNDNGVYKIGKL